MAGRIQRALWEIAVEQYGYVSTQDARELGIDTVELRKLAAREQLRHVTYGVYRFPQIPVTERDHYMLAVLWTGSREAALSHDTALAVHELCDINPDRIHLAVPAASRIRRRGGEFYVLHRADLPESDVDWWEGIKTVPPRTAIAQGIDSGVPSALLRQALATARARGRITIDERDQLVIALEGRE